MSNVFHGGGIAEAARRYGRPASDWLDLSTGINPVPPSLPVLEPGLWHRLPDSDLMMATRAAAAQYYGSGEVLPLLSAGTQPVIRLLAGLADRSRRVAILAPTYGEYAAVFSSFDFAIDEIFDFSEINADHGVIIIVNPNNPDGRRYSRADLLALALDVSARGAMLVVDEAFGDLYPQLSLVGDVTHHPHLVVLRSFGKFFGFAGLRLAFAIAGDAYKRAIEEGLGPWPVSGPALAIAQHCFGLSTAELHSGIRARNHALGDVLKSAGLKIAGGAELFVLVQNDRASELHEHLCQNGILTRKFDYRADWLRIGLCAQEADLERLKTALEGWR